MERQNSNERDILDRADEDKVIPWAEGNGLWSKLTHLVSDLVAADLVAFFVDNPYASDSAASLAVRIGRQADRVEYALDALAEADFVQVVDLGGLRVYQLSEDAHRRQTLQQYATWLREGYHWARMVLDR